MKYLKKFNSVEDANSQGVDGLYNPHVSKVSGKRAINLVKINTASFTCSFDSSGRILNVSPVIPGPKSDEIWYTSTNGNIVTPYRTGISVFGANIVSNTYNNGKGIIKFDGVVTSVGSQAFYNCKTLMEVQLPQCSSVINAQAFHNCSELLRITLPNTLTSIGALAFAACFKLENVEFPNSVTSISDQAFNSCTSLTEVTIPNSVETIGQTSFNGCTSISKVTIGDSVLSIGAYAFYYCRALTEVICNPINPPTLGYCGFSENATDRKIKVPPESVNSYKATTNWSTYSSNIISQ